MAQAIIILLRLLVPLAILKNPFWGMVAAVLADGLDLELWKWLGLALEPNFSLSFAAYQLQDKILDTYLSTIALVPAGRWPEAIARRTGWALYIFRLGGAGIFTLTHQRVWLFVFPNLFEFFFLFYAWVVQYRPSFEIRNAKRLAAVLLLLLIPKLAEEYVLHLANAAPWIYFKHDLLGWPRSPFD